jgi:hypothetical protein
MTLLSLAARASVAAAFAAVISPAAVAQVVGQSAEPVVIPPASPPPAYAAPVVQPAPAVVTQPVVIGPAAPTHVVVAAPAGSRVVVPQGAVDTAVPLTAPFNPAPPNTTIETSAGHRTVRAVEGWDVYYDDNGVPHHSHALLIDGLDDQNSLAVRWAAERMWPLTVGTSHTRHAETSTAHAVTFTVLRTETITIPAGTFYTYLVQRQDHSPVDGTNDYRTMWYAPSVGAVVKADARDGRTGEISPPYQVLSMTLPRPVAQVAVVVPAWADTPEAQAEYCRQRGTSLRLADGRTLLLDCPAFVQADRASYESWLTAR